MSLTWKKKFYEGVARAITVVTVCPEKLSDSPEPTDEARFNAGVFTADFESKNRLQLEVIVGTAMIADNVVGSLNDEQFLEYVSDFGFCIGMQALGTGVSWFDEHKEFMLCVPKMVLPKVD